MNPFSGILAPFWRHLDSLCHQAVFCVLVAQLGGGAVFPLQDAYGQTRLVFDDSSSSQRPAVVELPEPLPEFDPDNPQAIGIILVFHRWPDDEDKRIILEKAAAAGLTKTDEISRFKMWLFKWNEWKKAAEAEKFCRSLPDLSSLEYCEPDSLLDPAAGLSTNE